MRRLLVIAGVALSACANPSPGASVMPVPLPIPCHIEPVERPVFAADTLTAGSDIFEKVKALLAERLQRQAYEGTLEAALRSCQ